MNEKNIRAYYEAIDAGDYERFADLLGPGVVHERPDRTIEGRETLVGFMRDGRPQKDTSHVVEAVYRTTDRTGETESDGACETENDGEVDDFAVQGRLLDANGNSMFGFVDVFAVEDEQIVRIRTYTR